jgi:crotonobetainyl-CoA:carnitine CoA-transferase CaiB-like acyl-CoA transferase
MNAGKSSVGLNLKTEQGRRSFLDLMTKADIYVENFAPGWLERLGLSHQMLIDLNPSLIILSESAYGETGPSRNRRAYAHIMTALAGVESLVGYPDGRIVPQQAGAVGDVVAANFGVLSVLAALQQRRRTGRGAILDMSQTEASATIAGIAFAEFALSGEPPVPQGNEDPRYCPHGIFATSREDEWMALSVRSDEQWALLCQTLGLADDEVRNFEDAASRLTDRSAVHGIISRHLASRKRAELLDTLRSAGVPSAPVLDCYAAEALHEFDERGLTRQVDHPVSGPMNLTTAPWHFDHIAGRPRSAFEPIGASTDRILRDLTDIDDETLRRGHVEGSLA